MKLPEEFVQKMKRLLGEQEYQELEMSYGMPRHYGIRVNTLKVSVEDFFRISPFQLEKVPWSKDGFYYEAGEAPGKHPFYHAGLYYIQEPSAMLPAEVLGSRPGERVLDLCAAPGGKTVRIAADMQGMGLLVANDINAERVKALVKNIELCGVRNAVVTNASSDILAARFPEYFDRILADAPCSGEGMFRKDEDAVKSWGKFKCETCSRMQQTILEDAGKMLKPGGTVVYSTCTFSPEEDEMIISDFLNRHPEYYLKEIGKVGGIEGGRPEWAGGRVELARTARLWPHRLEGEGHFVACLVKGTENEAKYFDGPASRLTAEKAIPEPFKNFSHEYLNDVPAGLYSLVGKNLYLLPDELPDFSGIRVSKFGWYLGETDNGRFEPSHSLVMALDKSNIKRVLDFPQNSDEIRRYLRGETLVEGGEKGYYAVCVEGFTIGWAKQTGDTLKNLYPKGWRRQS